MAEILYFESRIGGFLEGDLVEKYLSEILYLTLAFLLFILLIILWYFKRVSLCVVFGQFLVLKLMLGVMFLVSLVVLLGLVWLPLGLVSGMVFLCVFIFVYFDSEVLRKD